MQVTRYDQVELGDAHLTAEGYLDVKACPISRTGVFPYYFADGTMLREVKLPHELAAAVTSFNNKPVTNEHPQEFVQASNVAKYSVGMTHSNAHMQDDRLVVDLTITDPQTVQEIRDGQRQELSIGFSANVEKQAGQLNGDHYDAVQTQIQGNHVAVVTAGRAGHSVRIPQMDAQPVIAQQISDAGYTFFETIDKGGLHMDTTTTTKPAPTTADPNAEAEPTTLAAALQLIATLRQQLAKLTAKQPVVSENGEQAQADAAQLEMQRLSDTQQARIDARVQLQLDAAERLPQGFQFAGKSDREIKAAVIHTLQPTLRLDNVDQRFIDGYYSALQKVSVNTFGGIQPVQQAQFDALDPHSAKYQFTHAYELTHQREGL